MADSILRLKVDSQEYDNKLKRAADSIQRYADGCRKAGGTLEYVDDGIVEVTRSLGKMETTANSARGKIAEMTKAFTDMSVQYNQLTEDEKKGTFGKALSESLNTLKGRIQEGKTELDDINKSLNGGGGLKDALNQVAGKFGLNIEQLTKFGSVLGATSAALKVAKDAFFQNESNVDEWGRTVASSEGIYDSFLQALNNGDFSGFLSRIGEVIGKAREAYNALDELNTRMTIINPERTKLQARATELKATIRREGANSDSGRAAQAELRQLEGKLTQAFRTESKLNMNAFKAQVDAKLKNAGITLGKKDYDFLMRTFSSDASYMAMKRGARGSAGRNYEVGGSYDEGSTSSYDTRNMNQRLLDLFTDEWRREYSPYLNAAFSARGAAASTMLSDARYLKNGGDTGGGGGRSGGGSGNDNTPTYAADSIAAQTALVSELSKKWNEAGDEMRNSYLYELIQAENKLTEMKDAQSQLRNQQQARNDMKTVTTDLSADTLGIMPTIESIQQQLDANPLVIHVETAQKDIKATAESAKYAAAAVSSIGSAFNAIEDPAAKVAGIVMQAIATVAQAYAQALATDWSTKSNIWAFIAAAGASTASMITTIAAIHSATGYAEGGMIEGNSYSGDRIPIMANAGEIVLNKAQQATLANNLQNGGGQTVRVVGKISGSDILLSADRMLKTRGKQLAVWNG